MQAAAGSRGWARLFLPQFQQPLCFEEQGKKTLSCTQEVAPASGQWFGWSWAQAPGDIASENSGIFHHFPALYQFLQKNADKMCSSSYFNGLFTWRRRSYQCLRTVLHQEPYEGMKTMFLDMILSHNGLTLLHVWWEFCSSFIPFKTHKWYGNKLKNWHKTKQNKHQNHNTMNVA